GFLPGSVAETVCRRIDDTMEFMAAVHEVDCLPDPADRERELARLSTEIEKRNYDIFFTGVANQAFPINREIGGRWFDEMLFDPSVFEALHDTAMAAVP